MPYTTMWTLKISAREKGNLFQERTIKYDVRIYFYSNNYYKKNSKIFFVGSGIIEGQPINKRKFFKDLKKDKRVSFLEHNKDFFIYTYSENETSERAKAVKAAYNPQLIFLKPTVIYENGWEEWEIGSSQKKDLDIFVKNAENLKNTEVKVFYLKPQKIENLMIYTILPNLTDKQKNVLMLAVERGYYGYPRKIKLYQLAKEMNISLSTFQFHLAKAEAKLMPFLIKRFQT